MTPNLLILGQYRFIQFRKSVHQTSGCVGGGTEPKWTNHQRPCGSDHFWSFDRPLISSLVRLVISSVEPHPLLIILFSRCSTRLFLFSLPFFLGTSLLKTPDASENILLLFYYASWSANYGVFRLNNLKSWLHICTIIQTRFISLAPLFLW